jgi:dUTP pyrophosphatase
MKDNIRLFVNGDVKSPERKFGDAGIDFFVPYKSEKFISDLQEKNNNSVILTDEGILLQPGHDVLIPTYVHSRFSSKWMLRASNKSGIATKQKLRIGAEIVDSSYQGIIHMHVFNDGIEPTLIKYGQKLVQFVPVMVNDEDIEVVTNNEMTFEEFYEGHKSERGAGGFGHTGI